MLWYTQSWGDEGTKLLWHWSKISRDNWAFLNRRCSRTRALPKILFAEQSHLFVATKKNKEYTKML